MDIFSNREIAIFIWSVIAIIAILCIKSTRKSILPLLRTAFAWKLVLSYLMAATYTLVGVFILYKIGYWTTANLKDTIIWFLFSALATMFKISQNKESQDYIKEAIKDNIKFTIILEFIIGLYTYNLVTELIMVPIYVFMGLLIAISETDKQYEMVKKMLNFILIVFVVYQIGYSIHDAIIHIKELASYYKLKDLLLSPILAFWFVPFIICMAILIQYETFFAVVPNALKSKKLSRYAKLLAITHFGFDTKSLKRWQNDLFRKSPETKQDVMQTLLKMKALQKIESTPPKVDLVDGWSPYQAKEFLINEGIKTGNYQDSYDEIWFACSEYKNVSIGSILNNRISYYIYGNKTTVFKIELLLQVNDRPSAAEALTAMKYLCCLLTEQALSISMPNNISKAIKLCRNEQAKLKGFSFDLKKDSWPTNKGYSIIFSIIHPKAEKDYN